MRSAVQPDVGGVNLVAGPLIRAITEGAASPNVAHRHVLQAACSPRVAGLCAHITALPLGEDNRLIAMVTGRVRMNQLALPGTISVKCLAS